MRKPYTAKALLLATTGAMASMRETAFGARSYFATKKILERAERMRDDALLRAAEEKRLRKMQKRLKEQK